MSIYIDVCADIWFIDPWLAIAGDQGYPFLPFLATPFGNPAQEAYNKSLNTTRNTVERMFGVWKRRFPYVRYGSRQAVENARLAIVATAILHNIAVNANEGDASIAIRVLQSAAKWPPNTEELASS